MPDIARHHDGEHGEGEVRSGREDRNYDTKNLTVLCKSVLWAEYTSPDIGLKHTVVSTLEGPKDLVERYQADEAELWTKRKTWGGGR